MILLRNTTQPSLPSRRVHGENRKKQQKKKHKKWKQIKYYIIKETGISKITDTGVVASACNGYNIYNMEQYHRIAIFCTPPANLVRIRYCHK